MMHAVDGWELKRLERTTSKAADLVGRLKIFESIGSAQSVCDRTDLFDETVSAMRMVLLHGCDNVRLSNNMRATCVTDMLTMCDCVRACVVTFNATMAVDFADQVDALASDFADSARKLDKTWDET